jgi:hypothetical protein
VKFALRRAATVLLGCLRYSECAQRSRDWIAPSRVQNYVVTMVFAFTVLALIGLILIGVLPVWPFSRGWGYGPAVVIGIVFLMLLVMTLTGRVPGIGVS